MTSWHLLSYRNCFSCHIIIRLCLLGILVLGRIIILYFIFATSTTEVEFFEAGALLNLLSFLTTWKASVLNITIKIRCQIMGSGAYLVANISFSHISVAKVINSHWRILIGFKSSCLLFLSWVFIVLICVNTSSIWINNQESILRHFLRSIRGIRGIRQYLSTLGEDVSVIIHS